MNAGALQMTPLAADVLLPIARSSALSAQGAMAFALPDFEDLGLSAQSDAVASRPEMDIPSNREAPDLNLLLQVSGLIPPSPNLASSPLANITTQSDHPAASDERMGPLAASTAALRVPAASALAGDLSILASASDLLDQNATSCAQLLTAQAYVLTLGLAPVGTPTDLQGSPPIPPAPQAVAIDWRDIPASPDQVFGLVSMQSGAKVMGVDEAGSATHPLHARTSAPFAVGAKAAVQDPDLQFQSAAATATANDFLSVLAPVQAAPVMARMVDQPSTVAPQSEFVDRQLDLARDDLWLGELAKDIVALSERSETLSFRLLPRALGQLDVSIAMVEKGLSIEMSASSEDAQSIIATAQSRLVEDIRSQGVRVAEASVGHGGAQDGRGSQNGERGPPQIEVALSTSELPESSNSDEAARGRYA